MTIRVLLASQSPRRREMVQWLGFSEVLTAAAAVDERPLAGESPAEMAARLAERKAQAVNAPAGTWVLAADTIVDWQGQPLGKPRDADEARAMLRQLRSGPHLVHTGVALYDAHGGRLAVRLVTTTVEMRPYSAAEVEAYVAGGDPLDKAGAYAVQHAAFHPVARLDRCYANVVGLPLCAVAALFAAWGRPLAVDLPAVCQARFGYACPGADAGVVR